MHKLLSYDPLTGKLFWKAGHRFAFKEAGCLNKITGYIQIMSKGEQEYAHRLAWFITYGVWPEFIDHINGIKSDNRLINIRNVQKRVNHQNMKKFITNTSSVTGVYFYWQIGKWTAKIVVARKQINLGCFESFDEAVNARKQAEIDYGFHENHGRNN